MKLFEILGGKKMYCTKCGKENRDEAVFCCGCGAPIRRREESKEPFIQRIVKWWKNKYFMPVPMVLTVLAIITLIMPYCETQESKHTFFRVVETIRPVFGNSGYEFKETTTCLFAFVLLGISVMSLLIYMTKINTLAMISSLINSAAMAFIYFGCAVESIDEMNGRFYYYIDEDYARVLFGAKMMIFVAVVLAVACIGNYIFIVVKSIKTKKENKNN